MSALVAVAPLVATQESQQREYAFVRDAAERRGDEDTLRALREIGEPPWADSAKSLALERLADREGAVFHRRPNRFGVLIAGLLRGLVTPWEIPRIIRGNETSLRAMHAELLGVDLRRLVPEVGVPTFFMLGRHDRHLDARIAADYFERLRAPRKELTWFESSAHNVPFEEPDRFNAALVEALESALTGEPSNRARAPK